MLYNELPDWKISGLADLKNISALCPPLLFLLPNKLRRNLTFLKNGVKN
jgi:hypothetical protein